MAKAQWVDFFCGEGLVFVIFLILILLVLGFDDQSVNFDAISPVQSVQGLQRYCVISTQICIKPSEAKYMSNDENIPGPLLVQDLS